MIDVVSWPGYLLIVMSVIAVFRCLIAFGAGQSNQGMIIGVIAIVAPYVGSRVGGGRAPAGPPHRGPLV